MRGNFNPRSREGSDLSYNMARYTRTGFQSTLPRGERPITSSISSLIDLFQSTLPRGERHHSRIRLSACTCNFNPRSREGSDPVWDETGSNILISIHAPARGATLGDNSTAIFTTISIHAPARGATNETVTYNDLKNISIHAPARGATRFSGKHISTPKFISIHAPARGATRS